MTPAHGGGRRDAAAAKKRARSNKRDDQLTGALREAAAIIDVLRATEARARLATESLPAAVAYFDAEGLRRFSNATWETWLADLPAGRAAYAAASGETLDGERSRFEADVACADNRSRRLSFHVSRHPAADGAGDGTCVIGFDVTDQHNAEKALRDREEMRSLAMRGPNEGLWDWNPITKELYLSARLLAILGFDGDTLRTTSHEWLKLVHPDDQAAYQATVATHLKGLTEHFEAEYRVRDRTGQYRWVLARGLAQRGKDGQCYRMVGSIGDITGIKRREQTARANEARLRALVGMSGAIFLVLNRLGRVHEANREAERALGGDLIDIAGSPWRSLMDDAAAEAFAEQLRAAARGHAVRGFEHELRAGTPDARVLLWNIDRFDTWGPNGYEALFICAGQDITLRKHAEVALRDANEALERKIAERTSALTQEIAERRRAERDLLEAKELAEVANRAKSEFLANISHELRTPLNAIIGFAEMTRDEMVGPIGNKKYIDYAGVILKSAHHLLAVIGDVLDLAKIEAGRFSIDPCSVELSEIADASLVLLEERARTSGVTLVADYAPQLPTAWGDPVRIKQILLNLLSNAVKFTPAGGQVRLRLGRRDENWLELEVADQGCGMTEDEIKIAMEPFGQVDNKLSRSAGGTGLGLPLTRRFVELHGGRLSVSSAPGCGTSVRATVPVAPADAEAMCLLSSN